MPLEDIQRDRIRKLARLEEDNLDPYPASVKRDFLIVDVRARLSFLARRKRHFSIVGRLRALREHGGATFGDLEDGSGRIQLYITKDDLGRDYERFCSIIDIGDFVEVRGQAFKTRRGEPTIRAKSVIVISKALRPLPEKWHGLKDVEERFRRRYLDLLMNVETRERFSLRARVILALRDFFNREGFTEVETPILQAVPGGALARPFKTHHNALGIDLHLRIAPELYLKELLVGGMEKVYELGRSFRNEGIDAGHNPEFTTVEWYAAYWDENDMMACVERCIGKILKALRRTDEISFGGAVIAMKKKFARITFAEVLKRYALVLDYEKESRDSLAGRARQLGIDPSPSESKAKIADEIYKKICLPHLVNPIFVTHHPLEISPLAKKSSPTVARRFQLVIGGLELANAFSELNDPRDQRERFLGQQKLQAAGDEETHPVDEDFVEALEYGMPPAAGAGLGVDRLVMLLTGAKNIREVVLFPTLRSK